MKGLCKAVFFFCLGLFLFFALALSAKKILVAWLGDGLYKISDLQVERVAAFSVKTPMTNSRILILGDSTAAFSINAFDIPNANAFTLANSTSIESYYLLKRVLDSGGRPDCVLASFSFVWFLNRDFFWKTFAGGRFYRDDELAEIVQVSRAFKEPPGTLPFLLRELRRRASAIGLWDDKNMARLQYAFFSSSWEWRQVRAVRNSIWLNNGSNSLRDWRRFDGKLDPRYDADPEMTKTETEYFRKFLDLIKKFKVKLFIFEVPFSLAVPEGEAAEFWKKYESLILASKPDGLDLHFIRPPRIPGDLVISAGHLNTAGVKTMGPFLNKSLEACYR